jgi:hypothetical protein
MTTRTNPHRPFQEIPNEFNARVGTFWRELD